MDTNLDDTFFEEEKKGGKSKPPRDDYLEVNPKEKDSFKKEE